LKSIKDTILINFLYGAMMSGIDQGAHIAGFLGGAIFAYLFGPRLMILRQSNYGGRGKIIDRPLVNYIKYWRKLTQFESDEKR
jgi:hypothetical protein